MAVNESLREQLLKLCHQFEGSEFMAIHGKCDMDLAAPRCAKRVKALEALISQELKAQREAIRERLPEKKSQWDAIRKAIEENPDSDDYRIASALAVGYNQALDDVNKVLNKLEGGE